MSTPSTHRRRCGSGYRKRVGRCWSSTRMRRHDPRAAVDGLALSGWQFANRVVLRPWSEPRAARRAAPAAPARTCSAGRRGVRRAGRAPPPPTGGNARGGATAGLRSRRFGPAGGTAGRVGRAALPSVHLAGHQLWDPAAVVEGISARSAGDLQASLRTVVMEADAAVGAIVDALPAGSDIVVFSSLGMAAETSSTDVLGTMLRAILGGVVLDEGSASGSWRLRASLPASVRGRVASALPDSVATSLAARLELRGMNWSRTRAFAVPSDTNGLVRFNVRGREREGDRRAVRGRGARRRDPLWPRGLHDRR